MSETPAGHGCAGCPGNDEHPQSEAAESGKRPAAASVVTYPNGPLLVRGDFEIITPDGELVPRDRETVALCRCGGSAIKPYCDGTHKLMKFDTARRRPVPAPVAERSRPAGEEGNEEGTGEGDGSQSS
ncbi:CDGSH iron-sulfur domain-containing protein [Arthrobacter sunyaminii]|uniref:CDGSH iron-sulfur domain-containing protein n=1 Tax=Arthrobacter sunyaminii TaxID=2816859 RepID=A0A975S5V5_9MICC|nr:CDGSH iron-sulfur domain-containing protein [Arthrobacter sunyaminii]MBO0909282.1 CDGSH iron-sulfur domain-containing protein [Arthrobacter sunyaminii]QWQ36386.1 CDGSH iron-sulfur domain-containing protein [Arthrobacter sunyaminii]